MPLNLALKAYLSFAFLALYFRALRLSFDYIFTVRNWAKLFISRLADFNIELESGVFLEHILAQNLLKVNSVELFRAFVMRTLN